MPNSPSRPGPTLLKARWIVPISEPALENGAILIDGTRIEALLTREQLDRRSDKRQPEKHIDYGEAAILPGLINLHTHLDNSILACFDTDLALFPWIQALMVRRSGWSTEQWRQSNQFGARQAALAGTSLVVDSSYSGLSLAALAERGLRGVVGLELFGLQEEQVESAWRHWLERAQQLLEPCNPALQAALEAGRLALTVAPHAPYTVCPSLWSKACAWAREKNLPLLAHLSETLDECRWLSGENETIDSFHAFIRAARGTDKAPALSERASWRRPGASPVQHLHRHGLLDDRLVAAHAVHLHDTDIELLSLARSKVAHCPRSNARLRNGYAPLSRLRQAGITVGLGTDSLASCDDLSMRAEALFAVNLHRAVDPLSSFGAEQALRAITLDAARALGMDQQVGSLERGKLADIAVFSLAVPPAIAADNPCMQLVHGSCQLRDLMVDGRFVVKNGALLEATAPLPL